MNRLLDELATCEAIASDIRDTMEAIGPDHALYEALCQELSELEGTMRGIKAQANKLTA
jgi:hypothetical protein